MTQNHVDEQTEEGVAIPYDQIAPETLRNLVQKFVSRAQLQQVYGQGESRHRASPSA